LVNGSPQSLRELVATGAEGAHAEFKGIRPAVVVSFRIEANKSRHGLFGEQYARGRFSGEGEQGWHQVAVDCGTDCEEPAAVGFVQRQPARQAIEHLRGTDPDPGGQQFSGLTKGAGEHRSVQLLLTVERDEQPRLASK
jgi:hypothetical protein